MKNATIYIIIFTTSLLIITACNDSTSNVILPAECDAGFNICESDSTQCCEVICEDRYHICGELLSECCLDTTSHDVFWITDTLPGYDLFDAAIINENDIWVVGEIELGQSHGNTAHWDGESWTVIQIERPAPFENVFAFETDEIWFSDGCNIYRYDGNEFHKMWECYWQDGVVNKVRYIHGVTPTSIYFAGNGGFILYYDGNTFTQIQSDSETNFKSIVGVSDSEIWFFGMDPVALRMIIYKYNGAELTIYSDYIYSPLFINYHILAGWIYGLYTDSEEYLWILTNNGIYRCNSDDASDCDILTPTQELLMYAISGSSQNDLFYTGSSGDTYHYNGNSLYKFDQLRGNHVHYGLDVSENMVILVGVTDDYENSIIVRGYK